MSLWLAQLRAEHPERAQRMINDHWKQESDVLQARIEVILLEHLEEPATTREEWAKLKAKAIVNMLNERMMKLTARQALEIGLELWEWLEENPEKFKYEWPEWEKYGRMYADCPPCEYRGVADCSECLIYWRKKLGLYNHCLYYDSPFAKWCDARTSRSRRFWAGKVAKLHREALERLEE